VVRSPVEAEVYGLRLASLLLPSPAHRVGVLRELRSAYLRAFSLMHGHEDSATLGVLAHVWGGST